MKRPAVIPQQIIARKRDGDTLSAPELEALLTGYLDGQVGDDQMAAFLMAVYFNGLGDAELDVLVEVMLHSGDMLPRGGVRAPRVDKHSTGGVGDKVSLVLAPLAAEMGLVVPMMSGRGLGHTGGTLDKLESIPGFRTRISLDRFDRILRSVGCAMIGQTEEIAPLDRRLYALRDVTGTVPSLPLITASIMSKKLAESLDGLVLDVKVGEGAFLSHIDRARALARAMAGVGAARGLAVTAVLSAMDRPLGRTVGNALEAREAVECLAGGGADDLRELVTELAAEMSLAGGLVPDLDEGRRKAGETLAGGGALERFRRMVAEQGGSLDLSCDGYGLPAAPATEVVTANRAGVVAGINPRALGYGIIPMGGGRTRQDQDIDPRVGFELEVRVGDRVARGDPLAVVHGSTRDDLFIGARVVVEAVTIGDLPGSEPLPLIIERITA
ncbi:MAG: thymidine phosphorylase [Gemmatimonadota bacterium]|nr:thymidine phosphorylase [Gemmatimonadota bacterium]MDE2870895.1 thymidine phosphorylase [Gemmatimonadota bacterium]